MVYGKFLMSWRINPYIGERPMLSHAELQGAIERLSMDEDYRKALVSDSEKIMVDYGLDKNGMLAIQSVDPIGVQREDLRPVAICCTCFAAE